jgi:hypothetical protein
MTTQKAARASPELRKAPLSPRYRRNYTTPRGTTRFASQPPHDLREDAHVAPPFPAVVERFVRPVFLRGITPAQAIAINEDNAAQNASVIYTRHTTALRKVRAKTRHLIFAQPVKIAHKNPSIWEFESYKPDSLKWINRS